MACCCLRSCAKCSGFMGQSFINSKTSGEDLPLTKRVESDDRDPEDPEKNKRRSFVQKLQFLLEGCPSQCLMIMFTVGYSLSIFGLLGLEEISLGPLPQGYNFGWSWLLGLIVSLQISIELIVRVSSQGGFVFNMQSWIRFSAPFSHKVEMILIAALACHSGMSIATFVIAIHTNMEGDMTGTEDRHIAIVIVLLLHRLVRIWSILQGVSVESTEKKRRANAKTVWMHEYTKRGEEDERRAAVRMQKVMNRSSTQHLLACLVIFYCCVYSLPRTLPWLASVFWLARPFGYFTISALFFEFAVRLKAQGGENFFAPTLHKIQAILLISGTFMIAYASWTHDAIGTSEASWEPAGTATGLILLTHRFLRRLAIKCGVSASRFDSQGVFDAHVLGTFMKTWGDLLEVPPQNVRVKLPLPPNFNSEYEVHVEKAKVKPEAFDKLHLPFRVKDALIENFNFRVPGLRVQSNDQGATTIVDVKNMVVILGPGEGLAEAGGLDPLGTYWKYEMVQEAKFRLVELICRRLSAPPRPTAGPRAAVSSSRRYSVVESATVGVRSVKATLQKLKGKFRSRTFENVQMNIKNVVVQLDFAKGQLGNENVSFGLSVGSISLLRLIRQRANFEILRLSVYIETPSAKHYLGHQRSELGALVHNSAPADVIQKLIKINNQERLRLWAFHEADRWQHLPELQRHRRTERWPERSVTFSLLRTSASMGPPGTDDFHARTSMALPPGGPDDGGSWCWRAFSEPLRIAVDDEQLRSALRVVSCVKAWYTHDQSFKFHPPVRLADFWQVAWSDRSCGFTRHSLVRMWWVYAVQRVLALKGLRFKNFSRDLGWHAAAYSHYARLLSDVIERSNDLSADRMLTPAFELVRLGAKGWKDWEVLWAKELQVCLPISEIVSLRKEFLTKRFWGGSQEKNKACDDIDDGGNDSREVMADPESFPLLASAAGIWQASMPGIEIRVLQSLPPLHLKAADIERRKIPRPLLLKTRIAGVSLDAVIHPAEKWSLPDRSMGTVDGPQYKQSQSISSLGSESNYESQSVANTRIQVPCAITLSIGHFVATCPEAGPLLLGGSKDVCRISGFSELPKPEPGLLKGSWTGGGLACLIRLGIWPGVRIVLETHTADAYCVAYEPVMAKLHRYIVRDDWNDGIVRQISPRPLQTQFVPIEGHVVVCDSHVVLEGDKRSSWAAGDVFVIRESPTSIYNIVGPIIIRRVVLLGGGVQLDQQRTWLQWVPSETVNSRNISNRKWIFKEVLENKSLIVGKTSRASYSGPLRVSAARLGPLKSTVVVRDMMLAMSGASRELHEYATQVHEQRSPARQKRFLQLVFEDVAGVDGQDHDCELSLHFGPVHCFQVGVYCAASVLVEECRVRPCSMRGCRGEVSVTSEGACAPNFMSMGENTTTQGIFFDANGFNEVIVPESSRSADHDSDSDDDDAVLHHKSTLSTAISKIARYTSRSIEDDGSQRPSDRGTLQCNIWLDYFCGSAFNFSQNFNQQLDCKRPCFFRTDVLDVEGHMDAAEPRPGECVEEHLPPVYMRAAETAARKNRRRSRRVQTMVGPQFPTVDIEVQVVPRRDFGSNWLQKRAALWHAGLRGGLNFSSD